jgi:hypothetical protein
MGYCGTWHPSVCVVDLDDTVIALGAAYPAIPTNVEASGSGCAVQALGLAVTSAPPTRMLVFQESYAMLVGPLSTNASLDRDARTCKWQSTTPLHTQHVANMAALHLRSWQCIER